MEVKEYYNNIAGEYDKSRFENTYGKFIDRQERSFISALLKDKETVLNLGCGTGRFMDYCSHGADFSEGMLAIAEKNYPDKSYSVCEASTTPFTDNYFDAVICFHVIMHLSPEQTSTIFEEVQRILKPNGIFIVDYPSQSRRKITKGHHSSNWHGSNAFYQKEIRHLLRKAKLTPVKEKGVLFFPIHRVPVALRKIFFGLDQLFSSIFTKKYASYLISVSRKSND